MALLRSLIRQNGLAGVQHFLQLRYGSGKLKIRGIRTPVFFRAKTSDVPLFKQIFLNGEYHLRMPEFKPRTIIDAGANVGYSVVYFANRYPEAVITAIEPEDSNFVQLQQNTAGYDVECLKGGLWSREANLEIISHQVDHTGFEVRETTRTDQDTVRAFAIPEIMKSRGWETLDLAKIDIEGSEVEVLSENNSWIDKTAVIIVELHDRKRKGCSKAFLEAFAGKNFECFPFKQNLLMVNRSYYQGKVNH